MEKRRIRGHGLKRKVIMPKLILMRHAKSDRSHVAQADHERSLNTRGIRDAPLMANWLEEQQWIPDLILSSTSQRTLETGQLMTQCWQRQVISTATSELYLASPESILRTIKSDACGFEVVMVLAHNPGVSHFASSLADKIIQLPTAGLAVFDVSVKEWSDFRISSEVQFLEFMKPKSLQ